MANSQSLDLAFAMIILTTVANKHLHSFLLPFFLLSLSLRLPLIPPFLSSLFLVLPAIETTQTVPGLSPVTTSQPTTLPPTLPPTSPDTTATPQPTTLPPTPPDTTATPQPTTLPEIVLNNALRVSIQEYTVDRVSRGTGKEGRREGGREGEGIDGK